MIKVEEARDIILENTTTLGFESVDILSSLNRVLSENIYSREDLPPFNNSAMDGFAVVSSSVTGASAGQPCLLNIAGKLGAGHVSDCAVKGNAAFKIMTGAPIPDGADAVIPLESVQIEGSQIKISRKIEKWENVRFAGEDVRKGQLVIPKGKLIRPFEIAMLAAMNVASVRVFRKPEASILATGDEIIDLGEELSPGKVRNINSYSLCAQALKSGCRPVRLGSAGDNREEIKKKLEQGRKSDVLIISGGVSVGDYDYVKNVLEDMGMEQKFWKVAIKPGKPVLFGTLENTLVFGLPGNPGASMIAFEEFVLPAIYKLQGRDRRPWNEFRAILDGEIKKKQGFSHFIRGKTQIKEGRVFVKPAGLQSAGVISSMVFSDCLIVVPEDVAEYKNGDEVFIQITNEMGE